MEFFYLNFLCGLDIKLQKAMQIYTLYAVQYIRNCNCVLTKHLLVRLAMFHKNGRCLSSVSAAGVLNGLIGGSFILIAVFHLTSHLSSSNKTNDLYMGIDIHMVKKNRAMGDASIE